MLFFRLPLASTLFVFLVVVCLPAQAADYLELDLTDFETAERAFPEWLVEVTETGGEFVPKIGWQIDAGRPFGIGKLFLSIDRSRISQDLALTFTSPNTANVAVQLYDGSERLLAVDLLAERMRGGMEREVTTVVIPLSSYPTARHIVLRRLDGAVEMPYLALLPLTYPVAQSTAQLRDLVARFGEPISSENPYLNRIREELGEDFDPASLSAERLQPLFALARADQRDPIEEADLLAVLQVLGLQGYDFNAFDFVRAAGEGREEVVRLYLRAGMPVNVQGDNKYTALAEAATSGELRVLKLLCENGADLEMKTAGGNTALWMACYNSNFEAIRLLVEAGANVNAQGARGDLPANILVQWRFRDKRQTLAALKFLLEHGTDIELRDDRGRTMLHLAIDRGWTDDVREVLRFNPDLEALNKLGQTPMMAVKYRKNFRMERDLLAAGALPWDPDFDSPEDELVYKVHRREFRDVLELVRQGADPNISDLEGAPIAFRIVRNKDLALLKDMHQAGMRLDVRDPRNKSLLVAMSSSFDKRDEAIIAFLLEQGLDPNYPTPEDLQKQKPYWTPLMAAAVSGNAFRCRQLLAAGADPTVKNLPRRTAAMIAERNGYIQLASELREAEAEWAEKAEFSQLAD